MGYWFTCWSVLAKGWEAGSKPRSGEWYEILEVDGVSLLPDSIPFW
jgi:hypothetical protein